MDNVSFVLAALSQSYREASAEIKREAAPSDTGASTDERRPGTVGITDIPNEVLANIFEFSQPTVPGRLDKAHTPFIISQTCRRFRELALSLPRLWSSVCLWMCKDELEACLSRAKNIPLSVLIGEITCEISFDIFEAQCEYFMQLLAPLSQRWHVLYIDCSVGFVDDEDEIRPALEHLLHVLSTSNLDLSSLEDLHLSYPHPGSVDVIEPPLELTHPYASWNTSNLQTLQASQFIPEPLNSQALTSLRIAFDDGTFCVSMGDSVFQLLRHAASTLADFYLRFQPFELDDEDVPDTEVPIELSRLRSLQISSVKSVVTGIMKALITPALTTLSLAVELQYGETLERTWLYETVPANNSYEYLRDFNFSINNRPAEPNDIYFYLAPFLDKFRGLEHLALHAPDSVKMNIDNWHDLPSLKTFRLGCDFFVYDDFKGHVLRGLKRQPGFQHEFQLLTLEGLDSIAEEIMSQTCSSFPKHKLQFKKCVSFVLYLRS